MSENVALSEGVELMGSRTGWGDLDDEVVRAAIREDAVQVIKGVIADRDVMRAFWGGAIDAAQERAAMGTGKLALGALGTLLRKGAMMAGVGALLYYFGGWAALVAFIKGGH
jgi:hypothetical protein